MLHMLEVGKGTTESMIAATVTQLIQKVFNNDSIFAFFIMEKVI